MEHGSGVFDASTPAQERHALFGDPPKQNKSKRTTRDESVCATLAQLAFETKQSENIQGKSRKK